MLQGYQGTLATLQADGPSVTGTTATSLLGAATNVSAQARYTYATNQFYIGKTLRLSGVCRTSNIVTTPGTLTLDVRMGTTVIFNGGAMQLSTTAHTNLPLFFQILLTCRAVGPGTLTTFMGQGFAVSQCLSLTAVADSTTTPATLLMPNTTPTVGTGIDNTASQAVDMFATFSLTGNQTTLTTYVLEDLN
jgi:hypothetical protein